MPKQNLKPDTTPAAVVEALKTLGENVSLARRRRGLRHADLARKTGLALGTIRRVEEGSPTTAISAYFAILWALGLEREFQNLADPRRDEEGMTLERARTPRRARVSDELDANF